VRFVRSDLGVSLLEDHGAVVHLTIETHEGGLASRSGSNLTRPPERRRSKLFLTETCHIVAGVALFALAVVATIR
jgi:hypothetical protein